MKYKKTLKADNQINPEIKKGDVVKFIDGSSLSSDLVKNENLYIVNSYPQYFKSYESIEYIEGIVIEVGITDKYATGVVDNIYLQDIVVSLNGFKVRTSSMHVKKVREQTYRRGDKFLIGRQEYILAQIEFNEACLVCLKEGNRFREPITIGDSLKITHSELVEMGGEDVTLFKKF